MLAPVFDHVTIHVSDRAASERFYDTVLATLGFGRDGAAQWSEFSVVAADDESAVTRGLHIGFAATGHDEVRAFWQAGVDAGYRDDGEPGPRPEYGDDYFGGFLLDPDGNSAEGAFHDTLRQGGCVDHLWIRVADVPASKAFYDTVAAKAGFRLVDETPDRAHFSSGNGSFSVVAGKPTENLHMAFRGDRDEVLVDPDGNTVAINAR